MVDGRLQRVAADIVEIDVDTIGTQRGDPAWYIFGLVVDAFIDAAIVEEPAAFYLPAGYADNAASQSLPICAAFEPTEPAAPDTSSVSPALGWPISRSPT